ncbi:GtrA family protein [Desulfopila aestuarii]|uniref:Putative flippase GtrA (Transmembrane translocase of bactoprenol-linked glucose) n=1 Tax=Desulfopila aestuarii DSM 18488 TaxID=1121416 RepID=A0A1M7YL00_9BACT|nr:GtrA family protein [Desulfopila aestuarii]SHO53262.1 Putative flippase GtrA (transmembrane translocase of bactoprenol-linked glucose) [Desulfopila aestuarii DSM 18488]
MSLSSISATLPSSVKFGAVGALGTLLNLAIMALLIEKTATPTGYASFMATEVSIIHNFFINNCWTFGSRQLQSSLLNRFVRFHLIALFSLVVNVSITLALVRLGIWYLPAQALGILGAWIINYTTSNQLVFHDTTRPNV